MALGVCCCLEQISTPRTNETYKLSGEKRATNKVTLYQKHQIGWVRLLARSSLPAFRAELDALLSLPGGIGQLHFPASIVFFPILLFLHEDKRESKKSKTTLGGLTRGPS